MSSPLTRLFSRPQVLVLVASVVHMGVAAAADPTSDIQQQVAGVLAGATPAYATTAFGPRDGKTTTRTADTQEIAKQFLLGKTSSGLGSVQATKHSEAAVAWDKTEPEVRAVGQSDMQAAVKQLVAGARHASG